MALYAHVPFCLRKCQYCAFYSEPADESARERYVAAVLRELSWVAGDLVPTTVFFGGGTPSLLSAPQWERILSALRQLPEAPNHEWTIECNPATVSAEKVRLWREAGVNRISLGVQSFDESMLDRLGRIHSREDVFRSWEVLRQGGFTNLNLDLMFAVPGQSRHLWRETLGEAIALEPQHLSSYEVIYEDDTPLFEQLRAGEFDVDEELACEMYEDLVAAAEAHGFRQYEVANFARHLGPAASEIPSQACRHNVNYWRGGSFHGLGPSATSYVRGTRAKNVTNTLKYCEGIEAGRRPIEFQERLTPLARAGETAAFGLRMTAGWPFEEFKKVTGFDLREGWRQEMRELVERGWASQDEERFKLTPAGLRFADEAAREFLRPE